MKKIIAVLLSLWICQLSTAQVQFNISDVSGNKGDKVLVDINVTNFTDVASMMFSINWNPAHAKFVSVTNFSTVLPNWDASKIATPEQPTFDPGQLGASWNLPNSANFTIEEQNHRLFSIELELVGDPCSESFVEMTNTPRAIELASESQQIYTVTSNKGTLKVNGTGCNGTDGVVDFKVSNASTMSGGNVCVNVTVDDFVDISTVTIPIVWDPAMLKNCTLKSKGIPAALFTPNETHANGRFLWFDNSAENPVTLPNGSSLFEVCFDVVGASGSQTSVELKSVLQPSPADVAVADKDDKSLEFTVKNGTVTIQGGSSDVTFFYDESDIVLGQNTCIPVKTNNFNNILSFQYIMEFDNSRLEYTGVKNLNQSIGLSEEYFSQVSPTRVRASYTDLTIQGVTVPNGAVLYEMCFDVKGDCDQKTKVDFIGTDKVGIEITDVSGNILPYVFISNDLNIICPCKVTLIKDGLKSVTCNGGSDGALSVAADGGNGNYTYKWSNGQDGAAINNLKAGDYTVTVTDGAACNTTATFTVTQPDAITIQETIVNETTSCDGSITLNVSGGTAGYTYAWNDGKTDQNRTALCKGDYSVTVTDSKGCTATESYKVDPRPLDVESADITDVSCNGGADGAINLKIIGGCAPYTVTPSLSELKAGEYNITITDSSTPAVTINRSYTVAQPDPIKIDLVSITDSDATGNGQVDVTVSGGKQPYTFTWNPGGATTEDLSGVFSGSYTLTVKDANGCEQQSVAYTVGASELVVELDIKNFNDYQIDCYGSCNGEIVANVKAGNGSVTYTLNGEAVSLPKNDLCAGSYTLAYTDANGLTGSQAFEITSPDSLSVTLEDLSSCSSGKDGKATAKVSGGVPEYTYQWSGTTDTDASVDDLEAGSITLVVTDQNGCQRMETFEMDNCTGPSSCYQGSPILTPNEDGKNDVFKITCYENNNGTLYIFDRYGRTVYKQANYDNTWKGTNQSGTTLPENGYMWVLELITPEGTRNVYKGTVTILRATY